MPSRPDLPSLHGEDPGVTGDIAGPGGPYDRSGVVVEATNPILLQQSEVTLVEAARRGQTEREPAVALLLHGRFNKTSRTTRVLFMLGADGAASLVAQLLGIAKRAEADHPAFAAELRDRLAERWDEVPK